MRYRSIIPVAPFLALAILLAPAGPAVAVEGELGLSAGFSLPAHETTGRFGETVEPDVAYGLRGGMVLSPRFEWFADLTSVSLETVALLDDGDALAFRTGVDFMMNPGMAERWFVSAGVGYSEVDYGRAFYDFDYTFGSIGFGQRYQLQGGRRLRLEFRADVNPAGAGPIDEWFLNLHSMVSLTWGMGKQRTGTRGDRDGDGIPRTQDRCPETVAGWPVDGTGCALDSDGDDVPDGRDACPDSHPRTDSDEDGCAVDTDGDNVADGLDTCPDTPAGALVGLRGCPLDTDRDGVYDGIDLCPGTAAGAAVDKSGCPE
ncbi:MAG: thrombospondin type 3 repeat-containing protein [Acidobacteria bacterium]|uniref:Thrombospondin type 3 repeat-containing protein n=1 Tax=Candidatus Polarisedimenticola svalbardensis TaxID=2886004 RepID=A0A8J6XUH4_9BACT|nr:thrombospondin type 3 repeat-containing protein [Candidatus Polarisedimenticola svalbardensis]